MVFPAALDRRNLWRYIADRFTNTTQKIMADNRTKVDPRYLKYNKDEVEEILDGAVQLTENNDPMSLVE